MAFSALMKTLDGNLTREQFLQMAKLIEVRESCRGNYINSHYLMNWLELNGNGKNGKAYLELDYLLVLRMLLNHETVGASHLVQSVDQCLPFNQNKETLREYMDLKKTICQHLTDEQRVSIARLVGLSSELSAVDLFTEMEHLCYVGREDISQLYVIFGHPTVRSNHFDFNSLIYEYDRRCCGFRGTLATKIPIDEVRRPRAAVDPRREVAEPPQIPCNQLNSNQILNNDQNPNNEKPSGNSKKRSSDENSSENKQVKMECIICEDEQRNIVLVPCGHLCVCSECSNAIAICPMCRLNITGRQRCYIA